MQIVSASVGMPKDVPYRGGSVRTGIFKHPVGQRVLVRRLNLDGDGQADLTVHSKVPGLKALAPTQSEPPFLIAQVIVLALFIWLTILSAIRFRNEPPVSEARMGTPAGEMR